MDPKDFLQVLVEGEYNDGTKPDDEAIVGLLVALFGGSTDHLELPLMMIHSPENRKTLLPQLLKEQEEVLAKHGGELTYEGLLEMTLLENCIKEMLRMFPLPIVLMRKCSLRRVRGHRRPDLHHPEGRSRLHLRRGAEPPTGALRSAGRLQPRPARRRSIDLGGRGAGAGDNVQARAAGGHPPLGSSGGGGTRAWAASPSCRSRPSPRRSSATTTWSGRTRTGNLGRFPADCATPPPCNMKMKRRPDAEIVGGACFDNV